MAEEPDVVAHHQVDDKGDGVVWKFIAGLLAAILLAGAPGYLYLYLNTPTNGEFSRVRDNQQLVLQRLAVLEAQNAVAVTSLAAIQQKLDELENRPAGRQR